MAPVSHRVNRRHVVRLGLLGLVWCALSGAVFSGCRGLFTPAVPEPPSGRPIVVNYRSPELTLLTMEAGIAGKGQGSSAWLGAFPDTSEDGRDYHHFFDTGDVAVFEAACGCEAPPDWRKTHEQNFFLAFLDVRPSDDYAVQFTPVVDNPDPPASDEGNEQVLHRHYLVQATTPDGTSQLIIAIGFADLTFRKISADRWLITRWDDHVDPDIGVNPSDPYQLSLGRRRLESTR